MKKGVILTLFLIILGLVGTSVSAEEYYTNDKGLTFSQFQYDAMVELIGIDNVAKMSETEYNHFNVSNITVDNFTYNTYEENVLNTRSTYHETTAKKLTISKSCNEDHCQVVLINRWKGNPATRSYDMLGVRLSSASFYSSTNSMILVVDDDVYTPSGTKKASNGLAGAFKLPTSGNVNYASMTVLVNKVGLVYGSYQHAVKSISLSKALNFEFTSAGIGEVFDYPNSLEIMFDEMSGVNILIDYVA